MKNIVSTLAGLLLALASLPGAQAQTACSSDGVPPPAAVLERFLSADCEACWTAPATPAPSAEAPAMVLDWIVPGTLGDDAPLSAAATRDALERLALLGRPVPPRTDVHVTTLARAATARLRVAQGPAVNDYVGTNVAFAPPGGAGQRGPWHYYVLLVESVPAGADGTVVPRNVVRNMLHGIWDKREKLSNKERFAHRELRSMRIPDGARAERLRVVGWVEDAGGRTVATAQSTCR